MRPNIYILAIIMFIGLVWTRSSIGKFLEGNFAGTLNETLIRFASKNPYPWFKGFLENFAIPNSQVFGYLTLYGELFTAVTTLVIPFYLLFSKQINKNSLILLLLGLKVGIFLNLIFWLASGWLSPSTYSLNLLMLGVQVILAFYIYKLFLAQR